MKPELKEAYYENGSLQFQEWRINRKCHRENGPAVIWYYKDGSIELQKWCFNGKYHREDGPALIEYYPNGSVKHRSWWVNDKPLGKGDFDSVDMIKRMDAFSLFNAKEIARLKLDEPI